MLLNKAVGTCLMLFILLLLPIEPSAFVEPLPPPTWDFPETEEWYMKILFPGDLLGAAQ